jgi:hypothetical protein
MQATRAASATVRTNVGVLSRSRMPSGASLAVRVRYVGSPSRTIYLTSQSGVLKAASGKPVGYERQRHR